ncbi:MAG: tryptophan synthase subunit alpha [Myxococcota bacterium]
MVPGAARRRRRPRRPGARRGPRPRAEAPLTPADRLEASLRSPRSPGAALAGWVVGGYPSRAGFPAALAGVSVAVDAVAIAVPSPAPLADGGALARADADALASGTRLATLLEDLAAHRPHCPSLLVAPHAAVSDFGADALVAALVAIGIDGLLVPDLPADDEALAPLLADAGLAHAQLVAPDEDPDDAVAARCARARGLVCAAATRGVSGGALDVEAAVAALEALRAQVTVPLGAAFGVRRPDQARRLAAAADVLVLGTALVEPLSQGRDPGPALAAFRAAAAPPTPGTG